MSKIIVSMFLTGLFFGSGPCLASCGPLLISYIAGTKKNIPKSILTYIIFSLSRISVYLVLSLAIFTLSQLTVTRLLGSFAKYIFILGGGIMVFLGALLAFGKKIAFPFSQSLYNKMLGRDKKSILLLGLVIGLLPCAPLLAIFSYIGLVSRTWSASLLYALSFGVGTFISPLILLAILAGLIPRMLEGKKTVYYSIFSFICGLIIIFLGLQLIRGAF